MGIMFNLKLVIMKNLICLFSLMFAMVLMNTNCTKPTDDGLIPTDLNGAKWTCVSLDYAFGSQTHWSTIDDFCDLNKTKDFVSLDFTFTGTNVVLHTNYTGSIANDDINNNANWSSVSFTYSISGDVLDIDSGYLKFQIISYTTTNLVLKMTKGNTDMPIGGTYTLTR
jgi:hypothetical protein